MASLMIHLLIGQQYCKNQHIEDIDAFLEGNLAPDMVKNKAPTHFSKTERNATYTLSILNKVDLPRFCRETKVFDDYHKGVFLHLLTDYIYFNKYLINTPNYRKFDDHDQLKIRDTLYRDYHRVNKWLMEKYPELKLELIPDDMKTTRDDEMEIISKYAISKIIEYCSNVNLAKTYDELCAKYKQKPNSPEM